jgi:hypothetical protein
MTQEQALEYLADFSRAIGVPDHQIDRALQSLDGPEASTEADDYEMFEALKLREKAQGVVAYYKRLMRQRPDEYWRSKENQERYREALERSLAPLPVAQPARGEPDQGAPGAPAANRAVRRRAARGASRDPARGAGCACAK